MQTSLSCLFLFSCLTPFPAFLLFSFLAPRVLMSYTPPSAFRFVRIRLARLRDRVEKKARSRGWSLASVIRALLELWAEEDLVSPDQIGDANDRAPRSRKKKKDSSSG